MFTYIRNNFHPLWRLRKFTLYRSLQKRLDFAVPIKSGGIRFWVMLLRDFAYVAPNNGGEVVTRDVFGRIVREMGVTHLFDVGANVGSFAWHALNAKTGIEVYLFEPDRTNIRLLKKTIRSNRLENVHLWEGAVSNTRNPIDFFLDDASGAAGSIKDHGSNSYSLHAAYGMARKVSVQAITLDSYAESLPVSSRILIKIDVEGAEREVLDGSLIFTRRFRPFIIVECFDKNNLAPLAEVGYVAYSLPENYNYLLIPNEMVEVCKEKKILPDDALATMVSL